MIGRIFTALQVEIAKAARLKFAYVGLGLVLAAMLSVLWIRPIARDGVSDYGFISYATPMALNLLGLLLIQIYCANLIASETTAGTIRTILVRPIRRWEWLIAKLLAGMVYAVALSGMVSIVCWGLVLLRGDAMGVNLGGEVIYSAREMALTYALAWGLDLLPQFAAVAFAVMIASLTRSTVSAIGGAIGLSVVMDIVKHPLGIDDYWFSTYLESPWRAFQDSCDGLPATWFPMTAYCITTSLVALVVFASIATYALSRRDLTA
ncbi:MAG: ABC transporter permease [Candidatus Hydrogenedentes bacterium]|nr:ABC transporter permease [Candidatus Hydrogenedentota bacterium]